MHINCPQITLGHRIYYTLRFLAMQKKRFKHQVCNQFKNNKESIVPNVMQAHICILHNAKHCHTKLSWLMNILSQQSKDKGPVMLAQSAEMVQEKFMTIILWCISTKFQYLKQFSFHKQVFTFCLTKLLQYYIRVTKLKHCFRG